MPDLVCTWFPDIWFGIPITPCCIDHDLVAQTTAAHWDLMMCVIDRLGWWGVPIGGVMFLGLVGPPGMIYRKIQKMKHRQRGGFFMEKTMTLTSEQIRKVVGKSASQKIIDNVINSMNTFAAEFGLDRPERAVHFLAQIAHESAHFRTTTEYASGSNYEGRNDLGNVYPGDGRKFRGRGLIQLTGRTNTKKFTQWMRQRDPSCPDFEANPELVAEFPWAFLASVYYWESRNLNRYADTNNIETITRRINGGLNGYKDRLRYYDGFALAYLGFEINSSGIRGFQDHTKLVSDGISGPITRDAFHGALKGLNDYWKHVVDLPSEPPPNRTPSVPLGEQHSIWNTLAAIIGRFFLRR